MNTNRNRRNKHIIPMSELWVIQKSLVGHTDKILSMFELANVAAAIKGWPEIKERQPKYREFSKQYLIKFMDELNASVVKSPASYVYILQQGNGGAVKIGVADNVQSRIQSLQTGSAYRLNLIGTIACESRKKAYRLEGILHKKFSSFRLEGEWFARQVIFQLKSIKETITWEKENVVDNTLFNKVLRSRSRLVVGEIHA